MAGILSTAFLFFNKIKVVHSIPGRLRLSIPGLNKVPENMQQYEKYTTSIMKMHKGITDVSYSYITGKILVIYDPNVTNEKEIVDWLNFVWKKIVENQDLYNSMSVEEIEQNLDNFYNILYNELKKGE